MSATKVITNMYGVAPTQYVQLGQLDPLLRPLPLPPPPRTAIIKPNYGPLNPTATRPIYDSVNHYSRPQPNYQSLSLNPPGNRFDDMLKNPPTTGWAKSLDDDLSQRAYLDDLFTDRQKEIDFRKKIENDPVRLKSFDDAKDAWKKNFEKRKTNHTSFVSEFDLIQRNILSTNVTKGKESFKQLEPQELYDIDYNLLAFIAKFAEKDTSDMGRFLATIEEMDLPSKEKIMNHLKYVKSLEGANPGRPRHVVISDAIKSNSAQLTTEARKKLNLSLSNIGGILNKRAIKSTNAINKLVNENQTLIKRVAIGAGIGTGVLLTAGIILGVLGGLGLLVKDEDNEGDLTTPEPSSTPSPTTPSPTTPSPTPTTPVPLSLEDDIQTRMDKTWNGYQNNKITPEDMVGFMQLLIDEAELSGNKLDQSWYDSLSAIKERIKAIDEGIDDLADGKTTINDILNNNTPPLDEKSWAEKNWWVILLIIIGVILLFVIIIVLFKFLSPPKETNPYARLFR